MARALPASTRGTLESDRLVPIASFDGASLPAEATGPYLEKTLEGPPLTANTQLVIQEVAMPLVTVPVPAPATIWREAGHEPFVLRCVIEYTTRGSDLTLPTRWELMPPPIPPMPPPAMWLPT